MAYVSRTSPQEPETGRGRNPFVLVPTCYNTSPTARRTGEERYLDAGALARKIVDILADKQADDVLLLDISKVASFADYFVLASAQSVRQLKAMLESVDEELSPDGLKPMGREGEADSGWVLLDYGDVIVHLFGQEERRYYDLESLWHDATPLLRVQ